MHKPTLCRTKL